MPSLRVNQFAMPRVPPRGAQGLHRGQKAVLYLAGSTALRDILQILGLTAYKVGVSGRRDIEWRIRDLCARRYASILAPADRRNQTIIESSVGNEWFRSPLREPDEEEAALIATLPGGVFRDGAIEFRVPPEMTITEVDQRVRDLLFERNINRYLATKDGVFRLRDAGFPGNARFFSDYNLSGCIRRSLASELFCVRPNQELLVLIEALRQTLGTGI